MATTAQYTAQPNLELSQISTANTNRDGTGTLVTVASGPVTGAAVGIGERINRVVVQATGTTTTGVIRFYLSLDNGTTNRLILERLVPGITASTSVAAFRIEVPELVGFMLPGSSGGIQTLLRASTNNGETFNVIVESGLL
jgi:hypothetical protein